MFSDVPTEATAASSSSVPIDQLEAMVEATVHRLMTARRGGTPSATAVTRTNVATILNGWGTNVAATVRLLTTNALLLLAVGIGVEVNLVPNKKQTGFCKPNREPLENSIIATFEAMADAPPLDTIETAVQTESEFGDENSHSLTCLLPIGRLRQNAGVIGRSRTWCVCVCARTRLRTKSTPSTSSCRVAGASRCVSRAP